MTGRFKYIKSSDEVTLLCEWDDCRATYTHMDDFISHMTQHLRTFLPTADEVQSGEVASHACCWADCDHEIESVFEYIRHVYFHCFHSKLKCTGKHIMNRAGLSHCQLDPKSHNLIPELPQHLMCSWSHCFRVFENPYYFYRHVSDHVGSEYDSEKDYKQYKCLWEGCSTTVKTKTKLKEHLRSHTQEKVVACPTCGSLFSNNSKFNDHILRQTEGEVQSYECTHCNKRFATERILKDHVRQHVHKYRCPYCEMTCLTNSAFQCHIKFKHLEMRGFKCSECSYSAKTMNDLKKHSESHEEKFFACTVSGCNYTARHFYSLTRHFKSMHQNEGKLFICHLCSQRYTRGEKLTKHLKNNHNLRWPSGTGNHRFRYVIHDDGLYRLQTVRYESTDIESNSPEKGSRIIKVHLTAEPGSPQKPARRISKQLSPSEVPILPKPHTKPRRPRKGGNLAKGHSVVVGETGAAAVETTSGVVGTSRRSTDSHKAASDDDDGSAAVMVTGTQVGQTDGVVMTTASQIVGSASLVKMTAGQGSQMVSPEQEPQSSANRTVTIRKSKRNTRQKLGKFIRDRINQQAQKSPDKMKQSVDTPKAGSKRKRSGGVEKEELLSAKINRTDNSTDESIQLNTSTCDYSYNLDLLGDVALNTAQMVPKTSTPYPKTVKGRVRVQRGLRGSIVEFPDETNSESTSQIHIKMLQSVTVQEDMSKTVPVQKIHRTRKSHTRGLPDNIQVEEELPQTVIIQNKPSQPVPPDVSFESTESCAAYMESLLQSPVKGEDDSDNDDDFDQQGGESSRSYGLKQVVMYGNSPVKEGRGAMFTVTENADFTEVKPSMAL